MRLSAGFCAETGNTVKHWKCHYIWYSSGITANSYPYSLFKINSQCSKQLWICLKIQCC